jgi:CheY-like chemotaxis protein
MCNQNGPILLVEDENSDVELFKRAMTKAGLGQPVVAVHDGDEALEYLQGSGRHEGRAAYARPSMIVLDIKMPRRSGFEVLNWIRGREDELRHIPVMMLSSSNIGKDVMAAYEAGANAFVAKPASSAEYARMAGAFAAFWMRYNEQASCPRIIA